jgi:hypothetical protein
MVAISAVAAQGPQTKPDVEVDRAYHGNGVNVEGLGVCSITPDTVDCWNMDGVHDPGLTDRIRGFYTGGYNNEVSLKFGKKNRFLVVQTHPNQGLQLMSRAGGYLNMAGNQGSMDGNFEWVRVEPEPTETSASIIAILSNLPGDPPVDVPFVKGQKQMVGNVELEIGAYQPWTGNSYPNFVYNGAYDGPQQQTQKQWAIAVGSSDAMQFSASFTALDRRGRTINFVDKNGKIITGLQYLEEQQKHPRPGFGPGIYPGPYPMNGTANVQFMGGNIGGAFSLVTNIEPSQIGSLRVTTNRQLRVLIKGFPMDPK